MMHPFNIFGSPSSQDYDVMVFLAASQIPATIKERGNLCKHYDKALGILLPDKKVNTNIAVANEHGIISQVHKGTVDEVNNSIFYTYQYHNQFHPLQVVRQVERDVDLKLLRGMRIILSFLSRTEHREAVKKALQSDLLAKCKTLQEINLKTGLENIADFGKNNAKEDVLKNIAFQIGQCLGLMEGVEYYTKEAIAHAYPLLECYLLRNSYGAGHLDYDCFLLVKRLYARLPSMIKLVEK